jgi:alpha-tubulin suppressor-like RCC1 family protein
MAIGWNGLAYTWGLNGFGQSGRSDSVTVPTFFSADFIPTISNAVQGSLGAQHSLVLRNDGAVWSFGYGEYGQLGLGTFPTEQDIPTLTPYLTGKIAYVSAGTKHSLYLTTTGQILATGDNSYGQLGFGDFTTRTIPGIVLGLFGVTSVSVSPTGFHNMVTTSSGVAYAWGHNLFGQLGIGTTVHTPSPVAIPNLSNVKQVSTGTFHSLLLTTDSNNVTQVLGCGYNSNGELGLGDFKHRSTPFPVYFSLQNQVDSVAAGYSWTVFISQGILYVSGGNLAAEYVTPTVIHSLVPKSNMKLGKGGLYGSSIVTSGGDAYMMGDNRQGQLGFLENLNVIVSRFSPSIADSFNSTIDPILAIAMGYYHCHTIL